MGYCIVLAKEGRHSLKDFSASPRKMLQISAAKAVYWRQWFIYFHTTPQTVTILLSTDKNIFDSIIDRDVFCTLSKIYSEAKECTYFLNAPISSAFSCVGLKPFAQLSAIIRFSINYFSMNYD